MQRGPTLAEHLASSGRGDAGHAAVAEVVLALAQVAIELAAILASGDFAGETAGGGRGGGGDVQKALDIRAHEIVRTALLGTQVAILASEEASEVEILNPEGTLCVAIDPVDGSGNIDLNMPVGTIFSIVPRPLAMPYEAGATTAFGWPAGAAQVAAGFVVYGPQTSLVVTTGATVDLFALDRAEAVFTRAKAALRLPDVAPDEFAINSSNYRHWEEPVRALIDDCLAGTSGPFGRDFNMRWHGALVAEIYRILDRGGLYLYPNDAREGYHEGRLRLIYEAYPMALLLERAGGSASDGRRRILDINAKSLHQRVPLIAGSTAMVDALQARILRPSLWPPTAAPLFSSRGLFRS